MFFRGERKGQRDDFLPFLRQRSLQKRVSGLAKTKVPVFGNYRHARAVGKGGAGLGHDEIDFPRELGAEYYFRKIRTKEFAEFQKDTLDFTGLGKTQSGKVVFQFDDLGRFYEKGFPGSGFPIYISGNLSLERGRHRNQVFAFTHHHLGICVRSTFSLGPGKYRRSLFRYAALFRAHIPADGEKLVGRRIAHLAVLVKDVFYAAEYFRIHGDAGRHLFQFGIDTVLHAGEKCGDLPDCIQMGFKLAERQHVYPASLIFKQFEKRQGIHKAGCGETVFEHADKPHFVGQLQAETYLGRVGAETLVLYTRGGIVGAATLRNCPANPVEAKFFFCSCEISVHYNCLLSVPLSCFEVMQAASSAMLAMGRMAPSRTNEISPLCSLTTITSASLRSLMPTADLCLIP